MLQNTVQLAAHFVTCGNLDEPINKNQAITAEVFSLRFLTSLSYLQAFWKTDSPSIQGYKPIISKACYLRYEPLVGGL